MTENEIKLLGFKKQVDNSDEQSPYYYYTLEITPGLSFISNASDDLGEDGSWYVEIFNTQDPIVFNEMSKLQSIINNLNRHKCKRTRK